MSLEASLVYSEPLLRRAVLAYCRRSFGSAVPFLLALLLVAALLLLDGKVSPWEGFILGLLTVGLLVWMLVYISHYRNAISKFHEMGQAPATFRADEQNFTLQSNVGTSTFRWSTIKEVWCFDEFWLLLFSRAQFATLPTGNLSDEVREFIVRSVKAAGGKVK